MGPCCNPLPLQPEQSGGQGSNPTSTFERHDKGWWTRLALSYFCNFSAWTWVWLSGYMWRWKLQLHLHLEADRQSLLHCCCLVYRTTAEYCRLTSFFQSSTVLQLYSACTALKRNAAHDMNESICLTCMKSRSQPRNTVTLFAVSLFFHGSWYYFPVVYHSPKVLHTFGKIHVRSLQILLFEKILYAYLEMWCTPWLFH